MVKTYFSVDPSDHFHSSSNALDCTLRGRPVPYKRVSIARFTNRRFSPNTPARTSLNQSLAALKAIHQSDLPNFESTELQLEVVFYLPQRQLQRPPDLDNLAKFLMDAFQSAGLYTNDSQITRLVAEKRLAVDGKGATDVKLARRIIDIDIE